jgi:hypothetical protein
MITVQETTVWEDNTPNHKYILSNDGRVAYAYIKVGEQYPYIFNKPLKMDWKRRSYNILNKTRDYR